MKKPYLCSQKRSKMKIKFSEIKITIVGGGNLGHVAAGYLAAKHNTEVSLLTSRPEAWADTLSITDPDGRIIEGTLKKISSDPAEVVPGADIIIQCLPGFAIRDSLQQIKPHLDRHSFVGCIFASTGFFFEALKLLPDNPLFGFQRVPFISRITNYGHSAELRGYKEKLCLGVEQSCRKQEFADVISQLFDTPVELYNNYLEVSLSNSNPLLHPSRLYTMWEEWDGEPYPSNPEFYSEWTIEASELLISLDEEFQHLLDFLPVRKGVIQPILQYYESADAITLTQKLRSIPAFKGILSPMKKVEKGWVPDYSSRYFTEDFHHGMRYIVEIARAHEVSIPIMTKVYNWGVKVLENK